MLKGADSLQDKQTMRARYRKLRDALTKEQIVQKSEKITTSLLSFPAFEKAGCVLCYASFGSEVSTYPLIHILLARSCTVLLPVTDPKTNTMAAYRLQTTGELRTGGYGIPEPPAYPALKADPSGIDAVLLPGLVFGKGGHRIGYGKGYYDKYLPACAKAVKIALAYHFQVTDKVIFAPTDMRADYIITECEVICCGEKTC